MPVKHFTKVFAVHDAAIAVLTDDDEVSGEATYGALIDVPGIKSVTVSGTVETKTLRGDNKQLDADSVLTELSVEFEYAKLSLDIIAATLGTTVTDSGTGATEVASVTVKGASKPVPFKFQAVTTGTDTIGGDLLLTAHKCVLSSFPELGMAEEDYKTSPLSAACSPLLANDDWLTVAIRRTAAAIA